MKEESLKRMDYVKIAIELLLGFTLLFMVTKILGKTQINQITPFEFISALVLGELVGNAIYDKEVGVTQIIFALIIWGLLLFIIEVIEIKVLKWRGVIEGNPSIVIRKGLMDRKEMGKNKMSINQLQSLLRQKNVFSLREVYFAIIEPDGTVSVIKKQDYTSVTKKDLKLPSQDVHLPVNLIIDGSVLEDNLKNNGFNQTWLQNELKSRGYNDPKEIFFAEWLEADGLHLEPIQDK